MALIKNSKGRKEGSGYQRLFGNSELGFLLSRVQSAVITSGTELEKLIISLSNSVNDIDKLIIDLPEGTFLISKSVIKKSKLKSHFEPDLLIFNIDLHKHHCYIIELKDGDNFDTKKSQGESDLLKEFQSYFSSKIPFTTSIHICCFNQNDKDKIVEGFKKKITKEMAMTGQELCKLLSIDYDNIIKQRSNHQIQNVDYFLDQLLTIGIIKKLLVKKFNKSLNP
jgi:hypothetical protein